MSLYKKVLSINIVIFLSVYATQAQEQKNINFSKINLTVREAIGQIEEQTGKKFAFSDECVDLDKMIKLPSSSVSLTRAIELIIKDKKCEYKVLDYNVILTQKQEFFQILKGYLVDNETEIPICGATVRLMGESDVEVKTDSTGYFELQKVPVGDREIRISHQGYFTGVRGYNLTRDRTMKVNVRMIPREMSGCDEYQESEDIQHGKYLPRLDTLKKITEGDNKTMKVSTKNTSDTEYNSGRIQHNLFLIKTNLLLAPLASPNVQLEYAFTNKLSVELSISTNFAGEGIQSLRHVMVKPELRYWLCQPFEGHFLGISSTYVNYNVRTLPGYRAEFGDYEHKGTGIGAAITYGYQWALGKRWGLEASVGLGYMQFKYDEREYSTDRISKQNYGYFGPTWSGLSLVYVIR